MYKNGHVSVFGFFTSSVPHDEFSYSIFKNGFPAPYISRRNLMSTMPVIAFSDNGILPLTFVNEGTSLTMRTRMDANTQYFMQLEYDTDDLDNIV